MNAPQRLFPWTVAAAAVVVAAVQFGSIRQLRLEVAEVRSQLGPAELNLVERESEPENPSLGRVPVRPAPVIRNDLRTDHRLGELEKAVAELSRASEYLMDRGQLPFSETMRARILSEFADASLSDRDRLRALERLRRNGGITDDVATRAAAWLQTATNASTQRSLLQQLDGAENPALVPPLLSMVSAEDSDVREEAMDALSSFVDNPQVNEQLWNSFFNDPEEDVREEAEEALRSGTISEARLSDLQQRATDPQAPLEDRLTALRFLERVDADTSAATATLAQLAQNTTDPALRRELFRAFDQMNDPAVKLPLVYGLEDPNPLVREEAVDALADFRSDPAVEQWLQYVSRNDADPQVRREAFEALMDD